METFIIKYMSTDGLERMVSVKAEGKYEAIEWLNGERVDIKYIISVLQK